MISDIVGLTNDTESVSLLNGPIMAIYTTEQFDEVAAKLVSEMHWITIRETDEVFWYDEKEGFYKPYGDKIIREYCQLLFQKCNNKAVSEVIGSVRRQTGIDLAELYDANYINTQNGILNPETFELLPHSPHYKTLSKLPFRIDPSARNPKLWHHILTIIDPKDWSLIIELLWMCISGTNTHKKCFVFKGVTNTQKSTLADIIAMIVGEHNISRERVETFLGKYARFGSSQFIGKRMNIASEIGNLDAEGLEKLKSYVGAERQNTERKNSNVRLVFDPNRFVFLFTTNQLNAIYASINDASIIGRFQFLIFRNQITEKADGTFLNNFFESDEDKQTAVSTLINLVIAYKRGQMFGKIQKTKWSTIQETKAVLQLNKPKEDLYFEDEGRLVHSPGSKLTLDNILADFTRFVGRPVGRQEMGLILLKNGFKSSHSGETRYYKGIAFRTEIDVNQRSLV
jgi:hypothetical protein